MTIGVGRGLGELLGPVAWTDRDTVSVISSIVLYALAGLVAGFVTARLREAERRISLAQAREEVARTLHDGVLRTLAVVQHRTGDPDIVRLAHEQERELREFLFGTPGSVGGGGRVTIFAEPVDGALFCSVKDDGSGFDPAATTEGAGLRRSVRGRIAEVGGCVEVDGNPGRGAEVRCWVPART